MGPNDSDFMIIAAAAHMANRAYCIALGDTSQPLWKEAPDWQKDSAFNGVKATLTNPNHTPEDSHKSWLKQKISEGWIYGPVKDPEKKLHPCIVPYSDLPPEQKIKDDIFLATVREMAAMMGY